MFDTALVEHLICIKCGATSLRFEGGLLTCTQCGENYQTNSNFADFASNLNLKHQKEWKKTLEVYKSFLESFRTETIRTKNLSRESMRAKKRLVEFCGFSGKILDIGCSEGNMRNALPADTEYWGIEPIIEPSLSYPFPLFRGVGEYLPFKDCFFDGVSIISTLDHTIEPVRVLQESYRVLKHDGILGIMNTYKIGTLRNLFFLPYRTIQKLFQLDFQGLYRGLGLVIMRHDSAHLHSDFTVQFFQNTVQEIFAHTPKHKLIRNCIYLSVRK